MLAWWSWSSFQTWPPGSCLLALTDFSSLPGIQAGTGLQEDCVPTETQSPGVRAQVSGSVLGRGSNTPVPLQGPL
jgi:hypothetical protein